MGMIPSDVFFRGKKPQTGHGISKDPCGVLWGFLLMKSDFGYQKLRV